MSQTLHEITIEARAMREQIRRKLRKLQPKPSPTPHAEAQTPYPCSPSAAESGV